jgi:hypothetical protein
MVVWGSDEPKTPRASLQTSQTELQDVLADARSWGFCHDVRQPRLRIANTPIRW